MTGCRRGRHQHSHRLGEGATVLRDQLDGLVETGGVGSSLGQNRLALHRKRRVAGRHTGAVAPYGVDLSIVTKRAAGLSAMPGGKGVGRVTLVEDGEGSYELLRGEIGIKERQVVAGTHRLIDDRLGRHANRYSRRRRRARESAQTASAQGTGAAPSWMPRRGRRRSPAPDGSLAWCESAISPRYSVRTGTSRQQSTLKSCESRARSIRASARVSSCGMKTMPTPSSLPSGIESFSERIRKSRGIAASTPTPSLLLPSAAVAPRCASRASAVSACARIPFDATASTEATKPTPQESWSKRSSIKEAAGDGLKLTLPDEGAGAEAGTSARKLSIIHYTSDE